MALAKALEALGVARVVWIDDLFAQRPRDLAPIILENPSAVGEIGELSGFIEGAEFDPEGTEHRLRQAIADLPRERREQILELVLAAEAEAPPFKTPELAGEVVHKACEVLNVAPEDRLSFQDAPQRLAQLLEAGDSEIGYVIDLNEAGGSDTRGLEMLQILWQESSRGVPFILTHAAKTDTEGEKETEFRHQLAADAGERFGIPIAVIAKERLPIDASDTDGIERTFEIGLKRAGLRRAIYTVVGRARDKIEEAYADAANSLLRIAPEQLDRYVVERGQMEGVSELHIIERALTAQTSHSLRAFFAADPLVRESIDMVRALRPIALEMDPPKTSPELADFRKAEVWDSADIVNASYSPVACGDVFELDPEEDATKAANRKFVLLGQPCDIALRGDGTRVQTAGILVPITISPEGVQGTQKAPLLPFQLDGRRWRYDFRKACVAKLSILDLASFRADGRVRVDSGHEPATDLLPGQRTVYEARVAVADRVLAGAHQNMEPPLINQELALMLGDAPVFKHIQLGAFKKGDQRKVGRKVVEVPDRVTWHLRRVGRIRMPFAAWLLEQLLADMSRQAFEMDF